MNSALAFSPSHEPRNAPQRHRPKPPYVPLLSALVYLVGLAGASFGGAAIASFFMVIVRQANLPSLETNRAPLQAAPVARLAPMQSGRGHNNNG